MVMLTNRLPQQNNYTRPGIKPQNQNSGNIAFGEGFTQKFINTFFPGVAQKQKEIEKNVTKESNEALGLIGSLMAHHIDPKKADVENNAEQSTTVAVNEVAKETVKKPVMVTVDSTKQPVDTAVVTNPVVNVTAAAVAQMNNVAVKPNIKPIVPNNAFQPVGPPTLGQKLNVVV